MTNWRAEVTKLFDYQQDSFFLVNDSDYLLNDEEILKFFDQHGFQVIRFEDSISFRYYYESQYRYLLENNEVKIILYSNESDSDIFPYDFLSKGQSIYLSINQIFPRFSPTIIKQLDKEDLDVLYSVQNQFQGTTSDKDTTEFILKSVFKIAHELIDSNVDLYKLLFTMHYGKKDIPLSFREYLINQLLNKPGLTGMVFADLICSTQYFYQHIDKEWERFVKELESNNENIPIEETQIYKSHPFANSDIRRLMNDLFIEGVLHKIKVGKNIDYPSWMKFGIEYDKGEFSKEVIESLQNRILERLQKVSRYKDWIAIMDNLGEYKSLALQTKQDNYLKDASQLSQTVNEKFEHWMINNYHSLASLPPFPKPKMVHQIVHNLASSGRDDQLDKIALIVMDGMSFTQWKVIKQYLSRSGLHFEENGVFAWVPTLTSISRQSIFSGQIPVMFSDFIRTTVKEENHWKLFWGDHGYLKQYVQYQKGLGKENYRKEQISAFKRPNIRIYGAVVDVIDGFVHGASQGEKSIMAELEIWLKTNYLQYLLSDLLKAKYTVYMTSDHGNTESVGIGRISEGVLVNQKGERVRVYTDKRIYEDSAKEIDSISWSRVGLPEDYHVLLAKYGQAFVNQNERIVSHGGISMEEVIVPFIKVT